MKLNRTFLVCFGITVVLAGTACVWGLGGHQASANLKMLAAPATQGGKAQVRILWVPTKGWLPGKGVNVYRVNGANREKLTANPVQMQPDVLKPEVLTALKDAGTQSSESFSAGVTNKMSSSATFESLRSLSATLKTSGLPAQEIKQQLGKSDAMVNHMKMLKPADKSSSGSKTQSVDNAGLRGQLIFQAMANFELATKMGMTFTDSSVPAAGTVTYAIRGVNDTGQEDNSDLATATVTITETDTVPPSPTDLKGMQIDQDSVDLHWEFPADAESQKLGLPTYRVERINPNNNQSTMLTAAPLVIAFQGRTDGKAIAAVTTFRDDKAPVGAVKYRVTLNDSFGRQSHPVELNFTVEDLRTPDPVKHVTARLIYTGTSAGNFGRPGINTSTQRAFNLVFFRKVSPLKDGANSLAVDYHIYRDDSENPEGNTTTLQLQAGSANGDGLTIGDLNKLFGADYVKQQLAVLFVDAPSDRMASLEPRTVNNVATSFSNRPNEMQNLRAMLNEVYEVDDAQPPADHYYKYRVGSFYTRVGREAVKVPSSAVSVPLRVPPDKPSGLATAFNKSNSSFGFFDPNANKPSIELPNSMPKSSSSIGTLSKKSMKTKNGPDKPLVNAQNFTHATTAILGGTVNVSWSPVTQTKGMHYAVFRAPASGMYAVSNVSFTQGVGLGGRPTVKPVSTKAGTTYQYVLDLPRIDDSMWVKLGETKDTKWVDSIQRSHAEKFAYRIVALNRWGTPSDYSQVTKALVPATMPPSVPSVVAVSAVSTGGVAVVVKSNPPEEQVAKYVLVRKPMDSLSGSTSTGSSGQGNAQGNSGSVGTSGGGARGNIGQSIKQTMGASGPKANKIKIDMARFGAKPRTSAAASMAKGISQSNVKGQIGQVAKIKVTPELLSALDLASYQTVATFDVSNPSTVPAMITITDSTATPRVEYLYRIIAINTDKIGSNGSSPMEGVSPKVKADPVVSVSGTYSYNDPARIVSITWTPPTSGATGYFVRRRQLDNGNPGAPLNMATIAMGNSLAPATSWQDPYIRTGQTYIYEVVAIDSAGNLSDPVATQVGPIPPIPSNPDAIDPDGEDGKSGNNSNNGNIAGGANEGPGKPPADPAAYFSGTLPASKEAVFGKAYRTRENKLAFVIESASYQTSRITRDVENQRVWQPSGKEKLLVLNLAIKNISLETLEIGYQTLVAKVTNASGSISEPEDHLVGIGETFWTSFNLAAKQTVRCRMAILMDAQGGATKVTIDGGSGMVSEFDLSKNSVTKIAEPVVDPKDPSGYSAAADVVGKPRTRYPFLSLDAEFISVGRSSEKFDEDSLEDGSEFVVATIRVVNGVPFDSALEYGTFKLTLIDADGNKIEALHPIHQTKNQRVGLSLSAKGSEGDASTVRYLFPVKKGAAILRILIQQGNSRVVSFNVGG